MANVVFIYDEIGIVRVERRPTPLTDAANIGKKVIDIVRAADGALSPVDAAREYSALGVQVLEAQFSDRLTADEREAIYQAAREYDVITDSVRTEVRPGEYARIHGAHATDTGSAEQPADRVRVGSFDP